MRFFLLLFWMTMEIVQFPHPALRWKSKPVTEIDAQLRSTVREMFSLMYEAKGVGLAANQVALPFRFFIVNVTGNEALTDEEHVFINPEITQRKGSGEGEEGCLSLPEIYGSVRRADQITVEAFDLDGRPFEIQLTDLPARVVQHETDHLDGVLFPDRMTDVARREIEPALDDFETLFRRGQSAGEIPSDQDLQDRLKQIETSRR